MQNVHTGRMRMEKNFVDENGTTIEFPVENQLPKIVDLTSKLLIGKFPTNSLRPISQLVQWAQECKIPWELDAGIGHKEAFSGYHFLMKKTIERLNTEDHGFLGVLGWHPNHGSTFQSAKSKTHEGSDMVRKKYDIRPEKKQGRRESEGKAIDDANLGGCYREEKSSTLLSWNIGGLRPTQKKQQSCYYKKKVVYRSHENSAVHLIQESVNRSFDVIMACATV
eukprot:Gb_04798 [translate_table: standard]